MSLRPNYPSTTTSAPDQKNGSIIIAALTPAVEAAAGQEGWGIIT